jgi:hypothetical protein
LATFGVDVGADEMLALLEIKPGGVEMGVAVERCVFPLLARRGEETDLLCFD